MPSSVAVSTAMLSTPTPYRLTTTHFSAARITLSVVCAQHVRIPSTSRASSVSVSSSPSGATTSSAPTRANTALSGSKDGQA